MGVAAFFFFGVVVAFFFFGVVVAFFLVTPFGDFGVVFRATFVALVPLAFAFFFSADFAPEKRDMMNLMGANIPCLRL